MDIKTGSSWSRAEKLSVKRMYLTQGLSPSEIAKKLDRTNAEVSQVCYRQGWSKLRREKELSFHESAEQEAEGDVRDFVETVALRSQEMTEKGFELAGSARGSKEFADAANGTKIFVTLARVSMGLDGAQAKQNGMPSISIVFGRIAANERPVVSVTPTQDSIDLDLA